MTLHKLENESVLDHKYRILVDKAKGELEHGWDEIAQELNIGLAKDTIRKGTIFLPEFDEYLITKWSPTSQEMPTYKEVSEYKSDGSHISDKLIRLTEQDLKNPNKVLEAHGFDASEWELTNARHSMWNQSTDKTLHSSRITVKPKVNGFNIEKVIEKTMSNIKPYKRNVKVENGKNLLELIHTKIIKIH